MNKPNPNDYNFGYGHNMADQYKRDLIMWEKNSKTKEAILEKEMPDLIEYPHYILNSFQERAVYDAMDTFAKVMCLEFARWTCINGYTYHNKKWFHYNGNSLSEIELFDCFLSENK